MAERMQRTQRTPRRIVKLVRYFESVLDSPNASDKLKMQAAERLTELFLQVEQSVERTAIATVRAEARVAAAQAGSEQEPNAGIESAEDAAERFLAGRLKGETEDGE